LLIGLLAAACLALGVFAVAMSVMGKENPPAQKARAAQDTTKSAELAKSDRVEAQARAAGMAARNEAEKAVARKAAKEAAAREAAAREAAANEQNVQATTEATSTPAVPADTTMYLTVPKLGLQDIPVLEGTTEASLGQGAGHYTGSGYPWYPGSNTYIAGHRLGYPGTLSDHVFYYLPNLAEGDEIILSDTLGQTYTYQVSEILEVPITDLSVTAAVPGRDMVSLQTCIENYGDYWTEGPNWYVRYVVRADRVS